MQTIIFSLNSDDHLLHSLAHKLNLPIGSMSTRAFPDTETYMRILTDVRGKNILIVESLNQANTKILPLLFLINTLKDLGANKIILLAPYLAYMRQDQAFNPGESITSKYFAKILAQHLDHLLTVEPHLHRYNTLNEIYPIATSTISASPDIAQWIMGNVSMPLIIGPDAESLPWVQSIAKLISAPFVVLQKTRISDAKVTVSMPDLTQYAGHNPVLVDDIISTAQTMLTTISHLHKLQYPTPFCIGVHALFDEHTYHKLQNLCPGHFVTCNTVHHPSNQIDLSQTLAKAVQQILADIC